MLSSTTTIIGIIAGIGTTVSFIPQVYQITKEKKTENISLTMFCIHTSGVLTWVAYGILQENFIIIAFNAVAFLCCSYILICLVVFREPQKQMETLPF